ncbi:MAG: NAD-dependent deacetylase [Sporolactobacillus sp.]
MKTLNQYIAADRNIAVLTGAGVSVPSGIPPFRGANGLYQNKDVEHCLAIDYLNRHPRDFWKFYWSLFDADLLLRAQPNAVHRWLADLDNNHHVTIMTQNIDGLHLKAGSTHVIEVHGSFVRTICPKCGTIYRTDSIRSQAFPHCTAKLQNGRICDTVLKPDIVLFGEGIRGFDAAERAIQAADRLIILGTSLGVYPANTLPALAKMYDVPTLLINDRPALQMDSINRFVQSDFKHFDPNLPID